MKNTDSQISRGGKITVSCPAGHRLRGDSRFVGKTVKCPRCQVQFVFAPTSPTSDIRSVLDDRITDTGVMRILGDSPSPGPIPAVTESARTRPCPRCGTAVADNEVVCSYCNGYVAAMPAYLERLNTTGSVEQN